MWAAKQIPSAIGSWGDAVGRNWVQTLSNTYRRRVYGGSRNSTSNCTSYVQEMSKEEEDKFNQEELRLADLDDNGDELVQEQPTEEEERFNQEELRLAELDDGEDELVDIDLEKEDKWDEDVFIGSPEQMEQLSDEL